MTNLVAIILAEIFLSSPEIWQGSFYSGEVGSVKNYFLKMAAVQATRASIKDVMAKIYTFTPALAMPICTPLPSALTWSI